MESHWQQLYLFTGRYDDLRRNIENEWRGSRRRAEALRKHWLVDHARSSAIDAVGRRLDEAGLKVPADDRVWLGRAYLALRTGQYPEAETWLRKCQANRPEDPVVWRARLEWAITSDHLEEAVEAMRRVPADWLKREQILAIRAWLAARLGDEEAELAALNEWLEYVPGDTKAVARLIQRAARTGQREQVALLRRRKSELDELTGEYRQILEPGVPSGQFDKLGRLAETLGRWFEARGWWTLAARDLKHVDEAREALDRIDRIEQSLTTPRSRGQTPTRTSAPWLASRSDPRKPLGVEVGRLPSKDRSITGLDSKVPPHTVADVLADLIPVSTGERAGSPASVSVPIFRDDAQTAGLDFVYDNDPTALCRLPETMMGGVGLLDYDGDGWLDIYAVQGGRLAAHPAKQVQRDRLYRNRRDGTFEDVTVSAGLHSLAGGYGHGVAVGDFDNDGWPDLFITRWRSYALYRNRGNGTFEDVTEAAGLAGNRDWPTSAAFADFDGDGDLDLYVCHYTDWDQDHSPPCPHPSRPGKNTYCHPRTFSAIHDHSFRNDIGLFVDMSDQSGVSAADRDGRGLGVLAADLDDDGRIDLYVANDMSANFLFRNQGGFSFQETAAESGVAADAGGSYLAGMGIACGDLDGDGRMDLAVTNFYGESTTFYLNLGAGQFIDRTAAIGLAAPTRYLLGFGIAFFDANNDGRLDLAIANGHVNDIRPDAPYAMPARLLLGGDGGRLIDVSTRAGAPWQVPRLGRGLAVGDFDNDGRLDLVIVAEGDRLAFFHNQGPAGHFVTIRLEGLPGRSNRDAVGAKVTVTCEGRRQVAQRYGGGSFLSASDPRLHFGVGESNRIDEVEVRWPSGHVDHYANLVADAGYLLREGQPQAEPLPGWPRSGSR
jgi:tetratricopeptide (TPR) repeat protein